MVKSIILTIQFLILGKSYDKFIISVTRVPIVIMVQKMELEILTI